MADRGNDTRKEERNKKGSHHQSLLPCHRCKKQSHNYRRQDNDAITYWTDDDWVGNDCGLVRRTISVSCVRSHASAAKQMRPALFWDITQRIVAIPYRRFGKTYLSHLQRTRNPVPSSPVKKGFTDLMMVLIARPETSGIVTIRYVISQQSLDLISVSSLRDNSKALLKILVLAMMQFWCWASFLDVGPVCILTVLLPFRKNTLAAFSAWRW